MPGERLLAPAFRPARRTPRVVALGGGTGLPILLQGMRAALFPPGWMWEPSRDRDRLTAIVTVADDGGSSGRLRQAYRVLPPGDLRNCLLALADGDPRMAAIFSFRFNGGEEIGGHSLGNLILTALSQLESDFSRAVERGGEILAIRGRVLPSTGDDVVLLAEFADGSCVEGESRIASARRPIRRVRLKPEGARALPQARDAIGAADLIVIGPGSLYTSLIPILLIEELAEAVAHSRARIVLVMNLMTEPGETDGYTAADFVMAIRGHAPQVPIHDVLFNTAPIPPELIEHYAAEGTVPVPMEVPPLGALGVRPIARDLLGVGPKIRHDPQRLAQAVLELAAEVRE
ncbi:MAG: uridine diphosphate-N-acetylglucosamine-binding protein YvcK [Candidatus Rokubacteria bacterium]|nr:uridine diphosphate-N-acetylglucosamine-binding protein YvcK [Candidatus Rokubacteria bacterium]